jgi:hypothetical protein
MSNPDVVRYRMRLDNLFAQIGALSHDLELQSHWARYLCVLTSGFLETSVRAIYGQYARTKAAPFVANFVNTQLRDFQNPKMAKILELTQCFSPDWEKTLSDAVEGELKDAVDSIVANRHNIAHGREVGISYHAIRGYYDKAVKVVELIDTQCNG